MEAQHNKRITADGISCYTEARFLELAAAARTMSPKAQLIVLFGGDAGLRLGEIVAVKWSDVDTKRRILTVNHSIGRDAGKI